MKRTDGNNYDEDLFGTGKHGFQDGTASPNDGSIVKADWLNSIQEELIRLLRSGGILPSGGDLHQLAEALAESRKVRGGTATTGILDCVVTGLTHTPGSGVATLVPGVAYIGGARVVVSAAVLADEGDDDARAFTSGKDTYFQLNPEGERNYEEVNHAAAAPTPAAGFVNVSYVWNNAGTVTTTMVIPTSFTWGDPNSHRMAALNWRKSPDPPTLGATFDLFAIAHDGQTPGKFVTVGETAGGEDAAEAVTGSGEWTKRDTGGSVSFLGLAFGASVWCAVGGSGAIRTSSDAASWTSRTSGVATALNGVCFGNSLFVAVGASDVVLTSPDGITWTPRTATGTFRSVAWNGSLFVAVGDSGVVYTSPTGVTWTSRTSGTGSNLLAVCWHIDKFVAVGASGTIITSPDGITWTARSSAFTGTINGIASSGAWVVFVGSRIFASDDAISWLEAMDNPDGQNAVAWGGGRFVSVGNTDNAQPTVYLSMRV